MPWKGLAWHAIHKSYGHLRQGTRLVMSNCDFLELHDSTPAFWSCALLCAGQLAYLAPNVSQQNAQPFVPHSRRTVNVRPDWTLAQIAMEPLFYNPHMSGRYGARASDPPAFLRTERDKPGARPTLLRASPQRRQDASVMYKRSQDVAAAGFTHACHLLTLQHLSLIHI